MRNLIFAAIAAFVLPACLLAGQAEENLNDNPNLVTVGNTDGGGDPNKPDLTDPVNPGPDMSKVDMVEPPMCVLPANLKGGWNKCRIDGSPFPCNFTLNTNDPEHPCMAQCLNRFNCPIEGGNISVDAQGKMTCMTNDGYSVTCER